MIQYNIYEAKTKLSEIVKMVEDKKEDYIVLSRNGKPVAKISSYSPISRKGLFGCAKGLFEVPENFDELDIESDFEGEIF